VSEQPLPQPLPGPVTGRSRLRALKRLIYSQLSVWDGLRILFGREQPALRFQVLASPPSIYLNYAIRDEALEDFSRHINLRPGFRPCPIACLAGDTPRYMLTLNIYEVSGQVRGVRAEWSTYVLDDCGVPRYMVLEARAASRSLEPVNLFTAATTVAHRLQGEILHSVIDAGQEGRFESRLTLSDSHPVASPTPDWIAANDYIYWRNGVCDKTWYDSSLVSASLRIVPSADVAICDGTPWARFTESEPVNVVRYEAGIDFMVSPWFNL